LSKRDDQTELDTAPEENSGQAAASADKGGVEVTQDKVVGASAEPDFPEDEEDLDGATMIMQRPAFGEPLEPVEHFVDPGSSPTSDDIADWADAIGDPEEGNTIEMPVPSTLQGPSAKGPGSEGWVEPGAAEEQAKAPQEGNAAETIPGEQEILPPGAEPTGDQSLQEAEPQDRMAILMAALGKNDAPLKKTSTMPGHGEPGVRRIRPAHSAPPAMRRERSNPAVPVERPAEPEQPVAPQPVDELGITEPQAAVTPSDPTPPAEPAPAAAHDAPEPPLSDDDEGLTIPPPLEMTPEDLGAADITPPPVDVPAPMPPPVEESQPQVYFDPDQPSPFERVAMEEESAEVEVDIDLDLDGDDGDEHEDDDIAFYADEATPQTPLPALSPTDTVEATAPEEDVTPPPIPEAEAALINPVAAVPAAEEDEEILTSAPPLGQDPEPAPSPEPAPTGVPMLDHDDELDLEEMDEADIEELEETPGPAAIPAPVLAATEAPPEAPPPVLPDAPAPQARPTMAARNRPWYYDLFDQDWLKTIPAPPLEETEKEVDFIMDSLGITPQSSLLELGVGDGRHLLEFARRGFNITSYEMSLPLLLRSAEISHRFNIAAKYIQGDYRDLGMDDSFDAVYCVGTRFGFYDEESNQKVLRSVNRALRSGGRFLLDVLNRDYLLKDLPARIWRDGQDCLVLEEVDFDYFTSRLISRRTVAFEDGRHTEQEISVRVFSLHEIGKLLHRNGFSVLEVSGHASHRGYFFGDQSASMVLLAEKRS